MTRAILIACALLLAPAAASAQREVLLLGSSSVNGAAGRTLETELERWGVAVSRRGRGSSGFARPDFFDWRAEVYALGPLHGYSLVLVMVGGNDTQALRADDGWIQWRDEVAWAREYAARVRDFIDALCAHGAPRVAVLLPLDGGRPGWSDRIVRVRRAQTLGAQESECGVAIDAGEDEFEATDGVHLSGRGARRMWGRIEDAMRVLLDVPAG